MRIIGIALINCSRPLSWINLADGCKRSQETRTPQEQSRRKAESFSAEALERALANCKALREITYSCAVSIKQRLHDLLDHL